MINVNNIVLDNKLNDTIGIPDFWLLCGKSKGVSYICNRISRVNLHTQSALTTVYFCVREIVASQESLYHRTYY